MAMASGVISATADTASPFLAAAVTGLSAQGTDVTPLSEPVGRPLAAAAVRAVSVDTVEISNKARGTGQGPAKQEELRKQPDQPARKQEALPDKIGDVLFVYNLRGDVRIRFMDSSNMLIYQIPPPMLTRMIDLMQSFGPFVSTKA